MFIVLRRHKNHAFFEMPIGHRLRCMAFLLLLLLCDGRFFFAQLIKYTTAADAAIFCTNTENPNLTIFGIIYGVSFGLSLG